MNAASPPQQLLDASTDVSMLTLVVLRRREIAHGIFLFELARDDGTALPPFRAGAHVVVVTPSGLTRRYSLCNAASETARYLIAVKRDAQGDGGSVSMTDRVNEGDVLSVSHPENYFPLADGTGKSLLIAGGIGITPVLAMARELRAAGRDFSLVYCTRSPETTAFAAELAAPEFAGRVQLHHDHGDPARSLAFAPLLAGRPEGAHVYCCGPRPLMQVVREAVRHWPSTAVHFEDFGSTRVEPAQAGQDRAFSVRLLQSGRTVPVPAGTSILEALRGHGISTPSSCESGTCGSCRTRLVAGVADHRDFVLDEDESEHEIIICVSRAKSDVLELDL